MLFKYAFQEFIAPFPGAGKLYLKEELTDPISISQWSGFAAETLEICNILVNGI